MQRLIDKYAHKLVMAGMADAGEPLIGGLDAELTWNRADPDCAELEKVFRGLNINSLLFSRPAEPYRSIIDYLAQSSRDAIYPSDCETRTFMHDLPVIDDFDAQQIIGRLKQRKSVIITGRGIVTWGIVSPEQAFIFYSSACFACFVKFFGDYLAARRHGTITTAQQQIFERAARFLEPFPEQAPDLMKGPFQSEAVTCQAICEAGRLTVQYRLVDSFFGNISFRFGNTLFISQTGSSLDELARCIDPCPLDASSCASITASSEFTAHRDVIMGSGMSGVLHGHPKFSVILSMDCEQADCELLGQCHIKCPEKRFIRDIPIVPGEVGTGAHGLCHTLPPALVGRRGAIVYGHGVFTAATTDFNDAFANLLQIERMCQEEYFRRAGKLMN